MANDTLLGQTESTDQYDGSGVFNPNTPNADADPSYIPMESNTDSDSSDDNSSESSTSPMLMYAGAALLLYFFFFKKK
jgi:ABC-type Na+ efflux pump permease subunit